jgi:hypothetical protein
MTSAELLRRATQQINLEDMTLQKEHTLYDSLLMKCLEQGHPERQKAFCVCLGMDG